MGLFQFASLLLSGDTQLVLASDQFDCWIIFINNN
uniref:Uncharacterized protein n=1 Tax=Rhizophora mucronata TaxID=61149 RepID=A0A2P2J003_RHIMU